MTTPQSQNAAFFNKFLKVAEGISPALGIDSHRTHIFPYASDDTAAAKQKKNERSIGTLSSKEKANRPFLVAHETRPVIHQLNRFQCR
jgi:hypothetical protein